MRRRIGSSAAGVVGRPDPAAQQRHKTPDQRQPNTGSSGGSGHGVVGAVEVVEDHFNIPIGDAGPGVREADRGHRLYARAGREHGE